MGDVSLIPTREIDSTDEMSSPVVVLRPQNAGKR